MHRIEEYMLFRKEKKVYEFIPISTIPVKDHKVFNLMT